MKGNSIAGFGIYANRNILHGEVIFKGEEKSQRMVTRRYVEKNWNEDEKEMFQPICLSCKQRGIFALG